MLLSYTPPNWNMPLRRKFKYRWRTWVLVLGDVGRIWYFKNVQTVSSSKSVSLGILQLYLMLASNCHKSWFPIFNVNTKWSQRDTIVCFGAIQLQVELCWISAIENKKVHFVFRMFYKCQNIATVGTATEKSRFILNGLQSKSCLEDFDRVISV